MSASHSLAPVACGLATAVFFVAAIFLAPELVYAQDVQGPDVYGKDRAPQSTPGGPAGKPGSTGSGGATCTCPGQQPESHRLWPRPKFAGAEPHASRETGVRARLDGRDELAALEAVHLALTEVGDGSAYVWHGRSGRLSGVVTPTASFKDASGKICRHIVVALSADGYSRSTEGVACRLSNGGWQLEG